MSVRLLAMEVYGAMRRVDELEKQKRLLPAGSSEEDELQRQIASAKVQLAKLKALMEGAKD